MSAPAHHQASPVTGSESHRTRDHHARSAPELKDDQSLLAGLWQAAPLIRLPPDAPPELKQYVQDIESPRRVYAIHRASRRHGFQLLVDKFVFQLRDGCGVSKCTTATCFTCRKRLAGKAPIRRYNPTSARTLAVYLASQDKPEDSLCPNLGQPRQVPPAVNSLIFSTRSPPSSHSESRATEPQGPSSLPRKSMPGFDVKSSHSTPLRKPRLSFSGSPSDSPHAHHVGNDTQAAPVTPSRVPANVCVSEKHVAKDYRSFAVATFGTVAFKMLEWLTPQGMEAMSDKISELGISHDSSVQSKSTGEKADLDSSLDASPLAQKTTTDNPTTSARTDVGNVTSKAPAEELQQSALAEATSPTKETKAKRNAKTTVRTSTSKPKKQPHDPISGPNPTEDTKQGPKPLALNGYYSEKLSRAARISRGIPEIPSKPVFFENVFPPSPLATQQVNVGLSDDEVEENLHSPDKATQDTVSETVEAESEPRKISAPSEMTLAPADFPLPQSLSQFNVELVDFMCDIFHEDNTCEADFFGPLEAHASYPKPQNRQDRLARRKSALHPASASQWKAFNEQTIFSVFSDPHALIRSFTQDGDLYDSQTMWYCMLRMTRVTPRLVLHSLWLAAESLFIPPIKALQSSARSSRWGGRKPLSNFEAGALLSVCLHALVAAAPFVSDSKTLYDMSRIRANGLVLGGNGASARQPYSTCLEYDDVFSNDFAMRLARRLFRGIAMRRHFSEEIPYRLRIKDSRHDVLEPLLNQLDLLGSEPIRILQFSAPEQLLHETRVPTLLLDWARAVLLNEWDGKPEFEMNSLFHGALSLIETMYKNRNILLLGDIQFRVDYFSERLDAMEMPVSWHESRLTRAKGHILSYPYLFSPESLVTFFRSLNFSMMSRTFEESSSLKTRMNAIVDPGSLITNPHHKAVLQDLLKTASSKYLVLEISRDNVLRDAFDQLWRRQFRELGRPLKVHLGEDRGEEGFDSGGVQQEFFRMAVSEFLDPKYGAFTVDERTRMAWFVPGSIVEVWKFELAGLLVSLAVYNGLTLPITFPRALYRKLMGERVEELYHIADGWPELANGLITLLEWNEKDGLVEDIFARTYEFSVPGIGGNVTRRMGEGRQTWPQGLNEATHKVDLPIDADTMDGEEAPLVTNDNRDQYVVDYIRYLTDVSIRPQYEAFKRGFFSCLAPQSTMLLNSPILQSIVEGVQEIDISELRRYTRYVGWDASHRTVKDFWSIVKRFDDRMKRKLLEFVTASDRVPVGGMRNLQFVVQRNGEEEGEGGHLPTAYTCYGTLLLPEYRDKEVLKERVIMALENAQGFGFA